MHRTLERTPTPFLWIPPDCICSHTHTHTQAQPLAETLHLPCRWRGFERWRHDTPGRSLRGRVDNHAPYSRKNAHIPASVEATLDALPCKAVMFHCALTVPRLCQHCPQFLSVWFFQLPFNSWGVHMCCPSPISLLVLAETLAVGGSSYSPLELLRHLGSRHDLNR